MNTQYGDTLMGFDPVTKFIIKIAISAFSYMQQRKAQKKAAAQARAARSNVLINKNSNSDPIYPLYGRQRMGGTRVLIESTDGAGDIDKTTHLNMVLVLCEGEIDTIEQLWFNDHVVWDVATGGTLVANGDGGYTLTGGWTSSVDRKYADGDMTFNWYPGSLTQTTDSATQTSVGAGIWSNQHTLTGVSYLAFTMIANGEVFGGQMPTITATMTGKKMLDVSQLVAGQTTPANFVTGADQNPADVMYDYLTSRYYGKGLDRDQNGNWVAGLHIDLDSFKQARIDCEQARSNIGYNINGFIQTEKQLFDNIGEIMEVCNGIILFVRGKYHFRIRKKNEQVGMPSSAIFTTENIIGDIALEMPSKSQKLNKATGVFNNPVTKYNDDMVIFKNDAYTVQDNGSVLETNQDYTLITDQALVLDLITQLVDQSRANFGVKFTAAHTALLLKSGDIIEIRHDEFAWGIKPDQTQRFWRVQELTLTEDNNVDIIATQYTSALEL